MDLSVLLLLALLVGFLLLLARGRPKAHGHLPPGPRPLPLLGNILQVDKKGLLKSFLKLQEKYGDVFTVYLGPRPVVVICGTDAVREALVDQAEAFSGRAQIAVVDSVFQGYGVVFANGERWKALRRFSLATMRDFGMGKRTVEERIQEEAQFLVKELQNTQGALRDPTFFFQSATSNIICSIVFGERFDYRDPEFLRMLDLIFQSFSLISSLSSQLFELYSSILKHFPGTHRHIYNNLQEIKDFIGRNVQKHRETLDPRAPRDLIDTYLLRMDKEKSNPKSEFHEENLINNSLSLFFAGTETTSTTIRYGFLLMLKYPHVTERIHKEIDQVIGSHRPPALEDRAKMPYTDAVIHEIQRFGDLIPIGIPHMVTKDTYFRGYILPKGTEVYPILSSALHDPRYFEKPNAFNPDHFLDANGALKKNDAFMPFSLGKRICLGEGIARAELFIFFTTILQNFSVASPMVPEDIDLTPKESGVVFASGKNWKALRRFSLATLKGFGMGKRRIEDRIKEEAQCLVEELRRFQGAYLDPHILFNSTMANIICSIVFGESFNYQDPRFSRLLHLLNDISTIFSSSYSQVFELLSNIMKHFPGTHTRLHSIIQELGDFVTENIERHRKTLDPSDPKDFIDSFLLYMDKARAAPDCGSALHQKNLVDTVLSLFFAGTETSGTTLSFGFLLLLKNPDVLGELGLCIPHSVIKDTHFRGYYLPKDTTVYCILSSALKDPHHFEKPDAFYPGHLLDAEGNFRKQEVFIPFSMGQLEEVQTVAQSRDTLVPSLDIPVDTACAEISSGYSGLHVDGTFVMVNPILQEDMNRAYESQKNEGKGKRLCLDESLAHAELFLFLTSMLQNFSLGPPKALEDIDLTPKTEGLGRVCPPFQVCFLPHGGG
ncbi:hypothetical protein CB1_001276010 [Camelus ferus]|nr:hypothetical protein CB1_001276010 [Camelus ferus]